MLALEREPKRVTFLNFANNALALLTKSTILQSAIELVHQVDEESWLLSSAGSTQGSVHVTKMQSTL